MRRRFVTVRVVRYWNRLSRQAMDAPCSRLAWVRSWAVWSCVRCLWQWGVGTRWSFKVLSSTSHFVILWLNEMNFCFSASEPLKIVLQASWRQTEYQKRNSRDFWQLTFLCFFFFLEQSRFLFQLLVIFVSKNSHFCVVSQSQLERDTDVLTSYFMCHDYSPIQSAPFLCTGSQLLASHVSICTFCSPYTFYTRL